MVKGVLKSAILGIIALLVFITITYFFRDSDSLVLVMLITGSVLIVGFMMFLKNQIDDWSEKLGVEEGGDEEFKFQQATFNKIPRLVSLKGKTKKPLIYPKIIEKREEMGLRRDEFKELREYVVKNFRKGKTEKEVRSALHVAGWEKRDVDKVIKDIKVKSVVSGRYKTKIKDKLDRLSKTIKDIEKKKKH